ncbi:MAG: RDD family protein [Candidatus Polarisedimenticolaceae bacterium]|nr:RDD family protein [Candidatus Polarisedimenticolaceae bacterium]
MAYDTLLLLSVLLLATAIIVIPLGMTTGEGQISDNIIYRLYLLLLIIGYFIWPWLRGGQTVGMRSWNVRLVSMDGERVVLKQVLIRLLAALLSWLAMGLGFFWILVDPAKLAWHDRLSNTRLILVEKK